MLRKRHNAAKSALIASVATGKPMRVLDVGCGQGGDFHKWGKVDALVLACDPNPAAIELARARVKKCDMKHVKNLMVGLIETTPEMAVFDVVCYNFSIHYVFATERMFRGTMAAIKARVAPGGKFIGTVFDSMALLGVSDYRDDLGNTVRRCPERTGHGRFGEYVDVFLSDTPYFANGPAPEPIAYKDLLITWMENNGFKLVDWSPLCDEVTRTITDLYAKFVFVRVD